jgi:hypothetical protein
MKVNIVSKPGDVFAIKKRYPAIPITEENINSKVFTMTQE